MILSLSVAISMPAVAGLGCESPPGRAIRGARHYAAGTDALAEGEQGRAVAELERAAELVPAASEIRNHLGLAYWASGRKTDARQAFEAAIDLDCDTAAARQNLESLIGAEPDSGSARDRARGVLPGEIDGG